MKLLLDFFPILAFFISYKFYDIYVATAVLIIASLLQTIGHWVIKKKFEKLHVITLVVSIVMGGLTLALRDESFIKWKVSVVYWLLSSIILIFMLRKRIALQELFEGLFKQPLGLKPALWHKINALWAIVLIAMGFINLWIAYRFSLDTWVNFKVWGTMIVQFALMIFTFVLIFKNMPEENKKLFEQDSE
ncbi:MAG: septation protein IspZ [Gammaproteobacteria bacterium]|nr:septation protein IspZ [Gammaproteobacteria bacterium]